MGRVCVWLTILDPNWKLDMMHYYYYSHGCRLSELCGTLGDNLASEFKRKGQLCWGLLDPMEQQAESRAPIIPGPQDVPAKGEGNEHERGSVLGWQPLSWEPHTPPKEAPSQSPLSLSLSLSSAASPLFHMSLADFSLLYSMVFLSLPLFLAAPNHQHMQGFAFFGVRLGCPQLCGQCPSDPLADPQANRVESRSCRASG